MRTWVLGEDVGKGEGLGMVEGECWCRRECRRGCGCGRGLRGWMRASAWEWPRVWSVSEGEGEGMGGGWDNDVDGVLARALSGP